MRYGTIVADPPWPESGKAWSNRQETSSSAAHYDLMSMRDIASLPVEEHLADQAHLYLWATTRSILDAKEVVTSWGFRPVTVVTWVKTSNKGNLLCGLGYYFKAATEFLVFGVRGTALPTWRAPAIPTVFYSPRLKHSQKPPFAHEVAESRSPGPRLELFAREHRPGWDVWGNEVESTIQL